MYDMIWTTYDITSTLYDITPRYDITHTIHTHYIRYHVHCICDITPTLSMIPQPLYVWYHIQYMWDILSTIFMTSYPLCMRSQPCLLITPTRHMYDIICATEAVTYTLSHQATIFMTSHPLQAWHHTPCIRHRTNCIFVIRTSPLISHPLLYDITPTISVTSYALYITSYPLLMSSHYSTYYSTTLTYETTSSMQFRIFTISVTSQSLVCVSHPLYWEHNTHSLYDLTLGTGIASFAL